MFSERSSASEVEAPERRKTELNEIEEKLRDARAEVFVEKRKLRRKTGRREVCMYRV